MVQKDLAPNMAAQPRRPAAVLIVPGVPGVPGEKKVAEVESEATALPRRDASRDGL